jgi:hypothetical protein
MGSSSNQSFAVCVIRLDPGDSSLPAVCIGFEACTRCRVLRRDTQ